MEDFVPEVKPTTYDAMEWCLRGGDGLVANVPEWMGIKEGSMLPSGGRVLYVFIHPESGCAWCIVNKNKKLYEVTLPYAEDVFPVY